MNNLYDTDYHRWAEQQKELLETGQFDRLDIKNLLEALGEVGKSEPRSLTSELKTILLHLLKYQYQTQRINPNLPEPYLCRSWLKSITRARVDVRTILEDSPSLESRLPELLPKAYGIAKILAVKEMNLYLQPHQHLTSDSYPDVCPWSFEQIMDEDWLP